MGSGWLGSAEACRDALRVKSAGSGPGWGFRARNLDLGEEGKKARSWGGGGGSGGECGGVGGVRELGSGEGESRVWGHRSPQNTAFPCIFIIKLYGLLVSCLRAYSIHEKGARISFSFRSYNSRVRLLRSLACNCIHFAHVVRDKRIREREYKKEKANYKSVNVVSPCTFVNSLTVLTF